MVRPNHEVQADDDSDDRRHEQQEGQSAPGIQHHDRARDNEQGSRPDLEARAHKTGDRQEGEQEAGGRGQDAARSIELEEDQEKPECREADG